MKIIICLLNLHFLIVIAANAQNVGIGTLTPQASLTVAPNRTVLFGADTLNTGTKMMWLPAKAAFRVGFTGGTVGSDVYWNTENIGLYSFAAGRNTLASGVNSIAIGRNAIATGEFATSIGQLTTAQGYGSNAMGNYTSAIGVEATAMGSDSYAVGNYSTSIGYNTITTGNSSSAFGNRTVARSFSSTSLGRYNDSIAGSSKSDWIATDPLFIVGNGLSDGDRRNAFVVYKNGNTDINGFTRLGEQVENAPKIKMKELSLSSSPDANGQSPINHGLNSSKIISVSALMEWTPGFFAPIEYSPDPLLRYNYFISPTQIIIQNNAANCSYICGKPVKVLITYKE